MDIEKLIERLCTESLYADKASLEIMDLCMGAATALSTLQAENEKLLDENRRWSEATRTLSCAIENLRAELEQVKRKRDSAVEQLHGVCSACKNYSPYHNRGRCRFCVYEPARNKDAEVNDNWQWRGPQKED